MASFFYSKVAPDFTDPTNRTGKLPGYLFQVAENDGGIIITITNAENMAATDRTEIKGIFVGFTEAEEIVTELQNAIKRAKTKGVDLVSGRVYEP